MARINFEKFNQGVLVKQINDGETNIKIFDSSYVNKTQEDIAMILENIKTIGYRAIWEEIKAEKVTENSRVT